MKELLKVICLVDGIYENEDERFCTKGKEYRVINYDGYNFDIYDDSGEYHCFNYDECDYFKLVYKGDLDIKIGESYKVVKNRGSYYGCCEDIQDLEGKVVRVTKDMGIDLNIIDSTGEDHTVRECNLEELHNISGEE